MQANRRMSTSKPSKARKSSIFRRTPKHPEHHTIDERTRVIQNNLVFADGLPFDLRNKQVLRSKIYFGRYGNVSKICVNSINSRKASYCQAYVTYESQLEAALAIVALDEYNLDGLPLKVSHGTTKYCSNFLRGYECRNQDCLYLHKFDEKKEVPHRDSKKIFKEQNDKAFDMVCDQIQFVVGKMIEQDGKEEGFPTFAEMTNFLINSRFITSERVQKLKLQQSSLPNLTAVKSDPPPTIKKQEQSSTQSKKSKNNSFSTIATPSKQQQEIEQNNSQKKIQKKIKEKSFRLEQAIEKMIIKKLLRTTQSKSKFHFVKSDKAHIDELAKLRSIVQKHLVTDN